MTNPAAPTRYLSAVPLSSPIFAFSPPRRRAPAHDLIARRVPDGLRQRGQTPREAARGSINKLSKPAFLGPASAGC